MIHIQESINLKAYNTFGISAKAKYFILISSLDQLTEALQFLSDNQPMPLLVLGGGSNILLTQDFSGLVLKIEIKGIELIKEEPEFVWLEVGAGVIWHQLVEYSVKNNWGGLENLSLIPGTVGAAPMQNIGAYGVEIKDTFEYLQAYDLDTKELVNFNREQCDFGYRHSIFKSSHQGRYIITKVCFRLSKNPIVNTSYGAISETLSTSGITNPSIQDVSHAVIQIRKSKLPNPAEIGNAGSFFKNPTISMQSYKNLQKKFESIPGYIQNENEVKVPAGWLIEQCGWKGKQIGETGMHKNQALVLVNYGNATGEELWNMALRVQQSVKEKFGIELQPEVNRI